MSFSLVTMVVAAKFPTRFPFIETMKDKEVVGHVASTSCKMILIAYANRIKDDDRDKTAWPGAKTLERETGLSERAIHYTKKALLMSGLLTDSGLYSNTGTKKIGINRGLLISLIPQNCDYYNPVPAEEELILLPANSIFAKR